MGGFAFGWACRRWCPRCARRRAGDRRRSRSRRGGAKPSAATAASGSRLQTRCVHPRPRTDTSSRTGEPCGASAALLQPTAGQQGGEQQAAQDRHREPFYHAPFHAYPPRVTVPPRMSLAPHSSDRSFRSGRSQAGRLPAAEGAPAQRRRGPVRRRERTRRAPAASAAGSRVRSVLVTRAAARHAGRRARAGPVPRLSWRRRRCWTRSPASTSTAAAWRSASARAGAAAAHRAGRGRARGSDRRRQPGRARASRRRVRRRRADALPALRRSVLPQGGARLARRGVQPAHRARPAAGPTISAALRGGGLALVAAVVEPGATPLARFQPPAAFALLLGAEGPGLSAGRARRLRSRVTIPMSAGADSLNVATAGAIFSGATAAGPRRRIVEPRPVHEQLARLGLAAGAEAGVAVADAHRADGRAADQARLAVAPAHLEEVAHLDLDRLVAPADLGDRVGAARARWRRAARRSPPRPACCRRSSGGAARRTGSRRRRRCRSRRARACPSRTRAPGRVAARSASRRRRA